jgi:hypothetical protein
MKVPADVMLSYVAAYERQRRSVFASMPPMTVEVEASPYRIVLPMKPPVLETPEPALDSQYGRPRGFRSSVAVSGVFHARSSRSSANDTMPSSRLLLRRLMYAAGLRLRRASRRSYI